MAEIYVPAQQKQQRRKQQQKHLLCAVFVCLLSLCREECQSLAFSIASPLQSRGRRQPPIQHEKQLHSTLFSTPKRSSCSSSNYNNFRSCRLGSPTPEENDGTRSASSIRSRTAAELPQQEYCEDTLIEPPTSKILACASPLFRDAHRLVVLTGKEDSTSRHGSSRTQVKEMEEASFPSSSSITQPYAWLKWAIVQYMIQCFMKELYQHTQVSAQQRDFMSKTLSFQRINNQVFEINNNLQYVWNAAGKASFEYGLVLTDEPSLLVR